MQDRLIVDEYSIARFALRTTTSWDRAGVHLIYALFSTQW
jgi:hypothetical protein